MTKKMTKLIKIDKKMTKLTKNVKNVKVDKNWQNCQKFFSTLFRTCRKLYNTSKTLKWDFSFNFQTLLCQDYWSHLLVIYGTFLRMEMTIVMKSLRISDFNFRWWFQINTLSSLRMASVSMPATVALRAKGTKRTFLTAVIANIAVLARIPIVAFRAFALFHTTSRKHKRKVDTNWLPTVWKQNVIKHANR